jgi:hypothetical protein
MLRERPSRDRQTSIKPNSEHWWCGIARLAPDDQKEPDLRAE